MTVMAFSTAALLFTQSLVQAQPTSAVDTQLVVPSTPQAEACELHIYPTTEIVDSSINYHALGKSTSPTGEESIAGYAAGSLYSGFQSAGSGKLRGLAVDQMKQLFSPQEQIADLNAVDLTSILRLPVGTKVIAEDALPTLYAKPDNEPMLSVYKAYTASMRKGFPIKETAATCYRELLVTSISIQKNFGTLKFSTAFVYRVFDKDHHEIHLYDGNNLIPKPDKFPATTEDGLTAANDAARAALGTNFTEWVARRVKF